MSQYDAMVIKKNKGLDANSLYLQGIPTSLDFGDDSDARPSSDTSLTPDSFTHFKVPKDHGTKSSNTPPGVSSRSRISTNLDATRKETRKKSPNGHLFSNFKSFGDKLNNSLLGGSFQGSFDETITKQYSHFRLRWSRIENNDNLNKLVRASTAKLSKRILELPEAVQEFEDNWKNLSQPPILPLATYYFPTESELGDSTRYEKLQYYVNLTGDIKQNSDDFVDELISHRLGLDFQIIDEESLDQFGRASSHAVVNKIDVRLSWGNVHHRIYSVANENLRCAIYTKKKERRIGSTVYPINYTPVYYRYLLYNDRAKGLVGKSIVLEGYKQINWNKFDVYVSNFMRERSFSKEHLVDLMNHKAKLISLILIPTRKNDVKNEDRIAKFDKLMSGIRDKLTMYGYKNPFGARVVTKRKDYKNYKDEKRYAKIFVGGQAAGFSHFYLQIDEAFCPKVAFHCSIYWFACASNTISEFIIAMATMARSLDFSLKFIPTRYKSVMCHPFESNLRINYSSPNIKKSLTKMIQKSPFNFVLDSFEEYTCFIHESAAVILYLFDNFMIWKENRLADLNIQPHSENEDLSTLCEKLFHKVTSCLVALEMIEELLQRITEKRFVMTERDSDHLKESSSLLENGSSIMSLHVNKEDDGTNAIRN